MTNTTRIRFLALFAAGFVIFTTAEAVWMALDPDLDSAWNSWGYLQKAAVLLAVASSWPLLRMSFTTFLDTFDDDDGFEPTKPEAMADALERATRNPRLPEVTK